jgi:hypothetical protein
MLTDVDLPAHLAPLLKFGDDQTLRERPEGWRDYPAELGLTTADVPSLLAVMDQWFHTITTEADEAGDALDASWAAPIHAWRALGQLQAVEAVGPMLAHADLVDEQMDDWSMSEWHEVFGLIGAAAIEPLAAYTADGSHREFARVMAIDGLQSIAVRHPEQRTRIVLAMGEQLGRHDASPIVNASLAGNLAKLGALECADVIERAFAADIIDESLYGHWGELRQQLGVEGLGLAPLERRKHWWTEGESISNWLDHQRFDADERARDRQKVKRQKAKRKAAAKARKRNRRAK